MQSTRNQISQRFKDVRATPYLIENIAGKGYRLSVEAKEIGFDTQNAAKIEEIADETETTTIENPLKDETGICAENLPENPFPVAPSRKKISAAISGGDWGFIVWISAIYAALYTIALFLEIAFQFERFGAMAKRVAPFVFVWIFVTAALGLAGVWRLAANGSSGFGAGVLFASFFGAAFALNLALSYFLPDFSITEAVYQTQTAQAAYLKNTIYFLLLASAFLLPTFQFVAVARREISNGNHAAILNLLLHKRRAVAPSGAFYWRVSVLSGVLILAIIFILGATNRLLDNLKPHVHLNLFSQLAFARGFLSFVFAASCLYWYAKNLNALKKHCLERKTNAF